MFQMCSLHIKRINQLLELRQYETDLCQTFCQLCYLTILKEQQGYHTYPDSKKQAVCEDIDYFHYFLKCFTIFKFKRMFCYIISVLKPS